MIVWKVTNINRKSYAIHGRWSRSYGLGVTTRRSERGGPFACFRTLDAALRFIGDYEYFFIFKCEAVESEDDAIWLDNEDASGVDLCDLPTGTVLCDAVTPLEEVA